MEVEQVLDRVASYGCRMVEVTGGEPLLQADVIPLLQALVERGHEVLLETGGSLCIKKVPADVRRIIDIKCPGSGESDKNLWENLAHVRDGDELKFVLADRVDYEWAVEQIRARGLGERCPLLFSPVHGDLDPGELACWVLEDRLAVRIQLQLHKLLWPGVPRGV
jgi:7-carboxy-7-deazaguanine synthase